MTTCGRSSVLVAATIVIGASAIGTTTAASRASGAGAERPAITVILYNYASVPADVVSGGKATVARLYDLAGVDIAWIDAQVDAACASFNPRATHDTFTVQMIVRPRLSHAVLGYVRGRARDTSGVAYISFDQTTRAARDRTQQPADVFGYAMAHEIAHLLLPTVVHTPHGLMRERWQDDDFRNIAAGYLRFTPSEEALIRARVDGVGVGVRSVGAQRADRGDGRGAHCGKERRDERAPRE
jgi:hypothetical protein